MPESNESGSIEAAFQRAREELERIPSSRVEIARRIAEVAMKPPRRTMAWSLAAAAIVLLGVATLWRFNAAPEKPIGSSAAAEPVSRYEIGGTEFVEHLSAIVDRRAVVVIWSRSGQSDAVGGRIGRYESFTLREEKTVDGRTRVCSLFIPDEGVVPCLEPPSVCSTSADRNFVSFSASPRAMSRTELVAAVASAPGGVTLEDLVRGIREHTQ